MFRVIIDVDQIFEEEKGDNNVCDILENFRVRMKLFVLVERLKVDEDDVVIDLFQYYKFKEFDFRVLIFIRFRG